MDLHDSTQRNRLYRREDRSIDAQSTRANQVPLDSRSVEAYSLPMTLSARNRLQGKIVELQLGGVMAHVAVKVGDNVIESVITKRSAEEMKLRIGDTVSAIIKSTEVMIEK